ncbi:unnamed protein product, partial [Adineta steineri]
MDTPHPPPLKASFPILLIIKYANISTHATHHASGHPTNGTAHAPEQHGKEHEGKPHEGASKPAHE